MHITQNEELYILYMCSITILNYFRFCILVNMIMLILPTMKLNI